MMLTADAVHTIGINWLSVLTICGIVVGMLSVVLGGLFGFIAKYVANQITIAIDRFSLNVITRMDKRLTILETLAGIKKLKDYDS
jgi:hypothetical protein